MYYVRTCIKITIPTVLYKYILKIYIPINVLYGFDVYNVCYILYIINIT